MLLTRPFCSRPVLALVALLALLSVGCKGPVGKTSRYARQATSVPDAPPEGKSLVFIHRPRKNSGHFLYANIWDGKRFIADVGNGHTSYYVCDPGEHYFILRSVENTSTIRGDLEAGGVYDFVVRPAFSWIVVSFKMDPIGADSGFRDDVEGWMQEHLMHEPIEPVGDALEFQTSKAQDTETLIGRYDQEDGKRIGPGDERR